MLPFSNFNEIESFVDDRNVLEKYQRVCMILGDSYKSYYHQVLSYWFDGNLPKTIFDQEIRKIIQPEYIKYHNEFITSIVNWLPIMSKDLEETEEIARNPTKYKYLNEPIESCNIFFKNLLGYIPSQPSSPSEIPEFINHNFIPKSTEEAIHTKFIANIIGSSTSYKTINLDVEKEVCELISSVLKFFLKNLIKRTSDNSYPKILSESYELTDFFIEKKTISVNDFLITLQQYPKTKSILNIMEKVRFLPGNSHSNLASLNIK